MVFPHIEIENTFSLSVIEDEVYIISIHCEDANFSFFAGALNRFMGIK